ncbi:hypothetical protein Lal_00042231 [Lupinus albus]|nr:hypothetical protein Lal_00042231 [Lupinus albus]
MTLMKIDNKFLTTKTNGSNNMPTWNVSQIPQIATAIFSTKVNNEPSTITINVKTCQCDQVMTIKGLADHYNTIKSQILLMEPLPAINKVFSEHKLSMSLLYATSLCHFYVPPITN